MRDRLENAIDRMQQEGAEHADIRYERFTTNKLEIKDRKVEEITTGDDSGVGFRAFYQGAWGFASTSRLDGLEDAALRAVRSAKALKRNSSVEAFDLEPQDPVEETLQDQAEIPPGVMNMEQKLAVLEDAERTMRYYSDAIRSGRVVYTDSEGRSMFVNSEGSFVERRPTHYSLYCFATARAGDKIETHLERSAAVDGIEHFQEEDPVNMGERAAEMAEKRVNAPRPPSGRMDVVIGDRLGGLFAHEAIGHAAEADTVQAGDSIFAGRKGEKVGADTVSVVDDPSLDAKHGSYRYDEEGMPARRTTLIENGVLQGFLHSRATSSKEGVEPTGNGRAEAFNSRPVVRMSNTFFQAGDSSKEEMVGTIDDGLYLRGFKGGQVSTAEGNFTFGTTHAYRIEDGEVTEMVRGPSLSGKALEVLKKVEMVGDDLNIGDPGYCGKDGQTVYVDTGSPHMKVADMVVG
jgi:TldD protein